MSNKSSERRERPTSRKIREARERGQVARSRDLASAISFGGVVLVLAWFGVTLIQRLTARIAFGLGQMSDRGHAVIDGQMLTTTVWADGLLLAAVVGPLALGAACASVGGSLVQTGWAPAPKALKLNWERLNPSSGFSRFGFKQAAPELVKALVGITAVGVVSYLLIRTFSMHAVDLMSMGPVDAARDGWTWIWRLLFRATIVMVLLAGFDFGIQYWRWYTSLKMTRQEVQDEHKSTEGNPEVKSRIRRIQRDVARRRMLQAVKTATVVIVNPTHYAVALRYERQHMLAPVVVAKGRDLLAGRIRTIAREHGVPIVENVSLARALFKGAEVGDTIPAALFGAVAEILAYLVRLRQLVL